MLYKSTIFDTTDSDSSLSYGWRDYFVTQDYVYSRQVFPMVLSL